MSTDLEKAEAVVRTIEEKRAAFVQQRSALCDERDDVALRAYIGDGQARKRLDEINTALATHVSELELLSLDAALRAANKQVVAAKQAVGHEAAKHHFKKLHEQLGALEALAGPLDACWGTLVATGYGGQRREIGPKNGPLFTKTGTIVGEIIKELRALSLDRGVTWPPRLWDVMHVDDLRLELQSFTEHFGRLPSPRACNFAGLIAVLVAALAQHEQTEERADAA
jgi:hypothetical protein